MRALLIVLLCLIAGGTARAEDPEAQGETTILYRTFKATVTVDALAGLPARVDAVAKQCGGSQTRFAVERGVGATANLIVTSTRLPDLSRALQSLGRVDSEEMDTSDYTTSMRQERRKLRMYRALAKAPLDGFLAPLDLSPEEKEALSAELRSQFADRVRSSESSMETYRGYLARTFVVLTFRAVEQPGRPVARPSSMVSSDEPADSRLLPFLVGGAVVLIAFLLFQRRLVRR